jgi:hypothetical protein
MNLKERLLSSINRHGFEKLRVASTRECNCATLDPRHATSYATSQQLEDASAMRSADSYATLDATSMQRLKIFMQLGLDNASSGELIVRLSSRDADWDSRYCCFECVSIRCIGSSEYICINARNAGALSRTFSLGDGKGYARQLQRCDGFKSALTMA